MNPNQNKGAPLPTNKHLKVEKGDKPEKGRHAGRSALSFHQRAVRGDDALRHLDAAMDSVGAYTGRKGVLTMPVGASYDHSLDSPHSAAPSPLLASQIQPSVNQNGDPTMPTLSPHPPPKPGEKGAGGGAGGERQDGGVGGDPYAKAPPSGGGGDKTEGEEAAVKAEGAPSEWADAVQRTQPPAQQQACEPPSLKRPRLPTSLYTDSDDLVTASLYDFSPLIVW